MDWFSEKIDRNILGLNFCDQSLPGPSQVPQLTWKSVGFPIPQKVGNWKTMADPGKKLHYSSDILCTAVTYCVHLSRKQFSQKKFLKCHGCPAGRPNMSSAQSSFQLEAIFTCWICSKSDIVFAGAVFFPISHLAWMPISPVGFVLEVISYLWELFFQFPIFPRCHLSSPVGFVHCGSSFLICYQGNPHFARKTTALREGWLYQNPWKSWHCQDWPSTSTSFTPITQD